METIFYRIDAAQMAVQDREVEKASGGQEGPCYVIVPKKKAASLPSGGGKIINFSAYRAAHSGERVQKEEKPDSVRIPVGLLIDLCASAAVVAVLVLVLIRFLLL